MQKIYITKEFSFEAAHALFLHDGLCKNIHGHSYRLLVTVSGIPVMDITSPKNGMVMDYGDLKEIVKKEIADKLDHSLMVYTASPQNRLEDLLKSTGAGPKIVRLDYPPTCEMMLIDFAERLKKLLPPHVTLEKLKLYETANSYASWKNE